MERELYKDLVYKQQNTLPSLIEETVIQGKISKCFLALSYIVHGDAKKASLVIKTLEKKLETRYCQEAKMLLASAQGKTSDAINIASNLVETYPDAIFAHYLLGYHSIKHPQKALEHYHIILRLYPKLDNVNLQIAEILTYLKEYPEAIQYVKKCKPTLKRNLYQLLIPLGFKRYRILLIILSILLAGVTGANIVLWGCITLVIIAVIITSLIKPGGTLIAHRLILSELIITLTWILTWFFVH
ncbi:MAG: hypothetical protein GY755_18365 [Chloroflexi bacterium]|nr:hypothetical protein [Chloroflexota bacterium]